MTRSAIPGKITSSSKFKFKSNENAYTHVQGAALQIFLQTRFAAFMNFMALIAKLVYTMSTILWRDVEITNNYRPDHKFYEQRKNK